MKKPPDSLGSLEHVVLLALLRLGPEAYGMTVRREIEQATRRELSIGAVHATLVRLQAKGLVASRAGEPTAERGGRAKRHFHLTVDGKAALKSTHEMLQKMGAGLKGMATS